MKTCLHKRKNRELFPAYSDSEGTRTPNPQNRNLIFYPLNYGAKLGCKNRKTGRQLQVCCVSEAIAPILINDDVLVDQYLSVQYTCPLSDD